MIDRAQLAEALGGLDLRDREILDYSLHRRVPDADLGETLGGTAEDVARLRTAAIERLSKEIGVQGAADLGDMLKALLEPATWDLLPTPAPPFAEDTEDRSAASETDTEDRSAPSETDTEKSSTPGARDTEERSAPRAEDADESFAPTGEDATEASPRGARRRLALGAAAAVLLLGPPALLVAVLSAHGNVHAEPGAATDAASFKPDPGAFGDSAFSGAKSAYRYPAVHVRGRTVLRDRPGGKVKLRIDSRTEFDSPRVLAVVEQRGDWLAVLAPELRNGEVGWIEAGAVDRFDSLAVSMHVDLSKRELVVRREAKVVRRMKIGVGRSTNPTPRGRYAVSDKLRVSDPGSPYDCCALALTGHQTNLPEGWPGGDRLAVHATRDTDGLGQAVSLGCMRTDPRDARWMMEAIPLGAPVFVRA